MDTLQNNVFNPYISKKLKKFLKAYKPKESITLPDVVDEVRVIMYEFECQRFKTRGRYSSDVVYSEDLDKFLKLIESRYPNAKQLCRGVVMANEYLDKNSEHLADFDSLTKH